MHNSTLSTKRSVGAIIATCALLVSACGSGSSTTPRQRNTALPTAIPVKHERSTVCTNFYGAYNKDISANGAEVTLRFCPDATRYVLTWADGSSTAAQVSPESDRVTISGQDFISKGKLTVQVFRDALSSEDSSIVSSVPLGYFELSTKTIDGSTQLTGYWIARANDTLMNQLSRHEVAGFESMPIFLGHVFDQLIWFTRERCRATLPSSESEAFNLQMSYETFATTFTGWTGRASIIAKNAQAPLATRRAQFRAFNNFQKKIAESSLESENGSTFEGSCTTTVEPLEDTLTEEKKKDLAESAPVLREASRAFDAAVCTGSYTSGTANELLLKVMEKVTDSTHWRFSEEPDKGALEAAHFRLMYFSFVGQEIQGTVSNFYGCGHQSWGQEVWTEQQIDWHINPTTTSSTSTSTTPIAGEKSVDIIVGEETATTVIGNVQQLPEVPSTVSKNVQAVQVPPALVVGRKLSHRNIATLAGVTIKKGSTLRVVSAKSSQKFCRNGKTAVTGRAVGKCQLSVSIVRNKKVVRTTALTLQVGK